MPFIDLGRALTLSVIIAALAACSYLPSKKEDGDEASEKVAKRADVALFGGSKKESEKEDGDDSKTEKEGSDEKDESDSSNAKKKEVSDSPPKPAKAKPKNLPMVLAPGAEKDAKAARSQYEQALTALKSGKDDQALVLMRDISNRYPNLSGPLLNQAVLLHKKGRLEEAQDLLKKSMLSSTQNPRVMNELGVVSRKLGNFKQAKSAYESAIRLAPAYDRPHYNLAVLADLYLNDAALAIKEFEMYQSLQDSRDKKVDGWLKELKRREAAP